MRTPGASLRELELLFAQLAAAARARLSFRDALAILRQEDEHGPYGGLLHTLAARLDQGDSLSSALAQTGPVFLPETVDFVRRAEASGILSRALDALAADYARRAVAQRAMRNALAYPSAIAVFLVVVLSAIMFFVMPAFVDFYADFGALPGVTRAFIAFPGFFMEYLLWPVLVLAALVAWLALFRESAPPRVVDAYDSLRLRIPMIGIFRRKLFQIRAASLLGIAAEGDRQFAAATLAHLRATSGNRPLAAWTKALEQRVAGGEDFLGVVRSTPDVPRRIATLLELGSKTGDIQAARQRLESWYDIELETSIRSFPIRALALFYIVFAVVLGSMLIAVYLPIFGLGAVI